MQRRPFLPTAVCCALALLASCPAGAHASSQPTDARPLDTWFVRASVGVGGHLGSENATLLETDGYHLGGRTWGMADFGYNLRFAHVGPWVGWSHSSSNGVTPQLRRDDALFGGQAAWLLTDGPLLFVFAARAGAARSALGFTDERQAVWGWAVGADGALVVPSLHAGLGVGATYAPVSSPSALDRSYNVGGLTLYLSLVLGD
jgi:hypothetical protein